MKKILFSLFLISNLALAQSTAMIAIVLEEGKESQYLAKKKIGTLLLKQLWMQD